MASVAAGLGVAVYGFSPSENLELFSRPAHAQVNNAMGKRIRSGSPISWSA